MTHARPATTRVLPKPHNARPPEAPQRASSRNAPQPDADRCLARQLHIGRDDGGDESWNVVPHLSPAEAQAAAALANVNTKREGPLKTFLNILSDRRCAPVLNALRTYVLSRLRPPTPRARPQRPQPLHSIGRTDQLRFLVAFTEHAPKESIEARSARFQAGVVVRPRPAATRIPCHFLFFFSETGLDPSLQTITQAITSNVAFAKTTDAELEILTEGLERYLTTKLYPLFVNRCIVSRPDSHSHRTHRPLLRSTPIPPPSSPLITHPTALFAHHPSHRPLLRLPLTTPPSSSARPLVPSSALALFACS